MSVRCTFGFVCLINFYKYFGALHPFKGQSPEVFVAFNVISASLGAEHRNIQLFICEMNSSLSRTQVIKNRETLSIGVYYYATSWLYYQFRTGQFLFKNCPAHVNFTLVLSDTLISVSAILRYALVQYPDKR